MLAYWYGLKGERDRRLKNPTAFRVSWLASLGWGTLLTISHLALDGFETYRNALPRLADMGNWLVAGMFGYYFAKSGEDAAARRAPSLPEQGP